MYLKAHGLSRQQYLLLPSPQGTDLPFTATNPAATDPQFLGQVAMEPHCSHVAAPGSRRSPADWHSSPEEPASSEKRTIESSKEGMMCPRTCYLPPERVNIAQNACGRSHLLLPHTVLTQAG